MIQRLRFDPDERPLFAFCESVFASGRSRWHIRRIDANVGLKPTGGIDGPCLCGHVRRGWDLLVRPTATNLNRAVVDDECLSLYRQATE